MKFQDSESAGSASRVAENSEDQVDLNEESEEPPIQKRQKVVSETMTKQDTFSPKDTSPRSENSLFKTE